MNMNLEEIQSVVRQRLGDPAEVVMKSFAEQWYEDGRAALPTVP